jgi:hypothetical protein
MTLFSFRNCIWYRGDEQHERIPQATHPCKNQELSSWWGKIHQHVPVITGDSLAVLPTLPAGCADLLVTDPPYNIDLDYPEYQDRRPEEQWIAATGAPTRKLLPPRSRPQLEILEARDVPSTLTVTTSQDGPVGSLRDEIAVAQPGDTIVFSPSLDNQTVMLTQGQLVINKNLTIQGDGHDAIGGGGSRVFEVDGATTNFTLSGVTIVRGSGYASSNPVASSQYDRLGGAILNIGTMTVSGCALFNNSALEGGAIYNFGTMTLTGCSVVYNSANYGGGIYNAGTLAIDSSDVASNTASAGADIFNVGTLTKDHSKIGHIAT